MDHTKNFDAGHRAEHDALRYLRIRNEVEDRSSWALDPDKPYAMDFYWPATRTAADFKYKNLNKKYNSFYLAAEHYKKYLDYVLHHPDVDKGYLWYMDRTTNEEYLLNIALLTKYIMTGTVKRYFSKTYKQPWESGYFYAIPVDIFKCITNEEYSVKSIKESVDK
jgi:hypothetical protein